MSSIFFRRSLVLRSFRLFAGAGFFCLRYLGLDLPGDHFFRADEIADLLRKLLVDLVPDIQDCRIVIADGRLSVLGIQLHVSVALHAGAGRDQLTDQHVLLQAAQMVGLSADRRLGQDLGGLLEGCCGQEGVGRQRGLCDSEDDLLAFRGNAGLLVKDGDVIEKGKQLQDGALNPHDVLRISGVEAVQEYLTQEVLAVYRQQGVDINDKHIEVIVRQMMRKVRVEEPGSTDLLSGTVIDSFEFDDANAKVQERIDAGETDLQLATRSLMLMGITKASLATESFLSAASFQETTKVLTEAAIKGKVDHLVGLKENVIIGKLIPAGSGLTVYRDYNVLKTPESPVTEDMIDNELLMG